MKLSFHYGLNSLDPSKYDGKLGLLRGCRNDATAMAGLFGTMGFTTVIRLDRDLVGNCEAKNTVNLATLDQIRADLTDAASKAVEGDTVVLTFSGHGTRTPNSVTCKYTYSICLYDGELTNRDLRALLCLFRPGVHVIIELDSCYSGGMALL